jgi:hypothetical protein
LYTILLGAFLPYFERGIAVHLARGLQPPNLLGGILLYLEKDLGPFIMEESFLFYPESFILS